MGSYNRKGVFGDGVAGARIRLSEIARRGKMKKVILVMMGLWCLLMVGQVQAQCTFSDVPESHNFYDYITGMCESGITTGYSDGTFRPGNNVTRGQMSAFLMRTIHRVYDANYQYLGNLIDVSDNDLEVFIPSLMKKIWIKPLSGDLRETDLYFESTDCTGQAYMDCQAGMFAVWRNSGQYYTGVNTIPIEISPGSSKYQGICGTGYFDEDYVLPVQEITLPFMTPVALPIRLE
jgi:hypothetical protein